MKKRIVNLKLSSKSCLDLKNKLLIYEKKLENLNSKYMIECLNWIKERSIQILDQEDTFTPSQVSDIRDKISIKMDYNVTYRYVLRYYSDIVAWVEFGTGFIGTTEPHPLAYEGNVYHYMSGENSGNPENDFKWFWKNPDYDNEKHITQGYVGKQFIYKAIKDFINRNQAIKIYQNLYENLEKTIFD